MIQAGLPQGYSNSEPADDYIHTAVDNFAQIPAEYENYSYLNVATCPDCGAGMVRLGSCFSCPLCGFGGCEG